MTTNKSPRLFGLNPCIYWGGGRGREAVARAIYRSIYLRRRPGESAANDRMSWAQEVRMRTSKRKGGAR